MINPTRKAKRATQIISILAKFGFKDLVARLPWSKENHLSHEIEDKSINPDSINVYSRIRMTLEALGPAFVKLGQAATTREGLLPIELVNELKKLEDNVENIDLDIQNFLFEQFGKTYKSNISAIDEVPFASASISQVYKAKLITGEDVILKIRRPNIKEILLTDLALMKDLANILANNIDTIKQLNLPLIVNSFASTLEQEISLTNEKLNIEKFSSNFHTNNDIYVPKVYPQLCNDEVLCMEYINGIKITEKTILENKGINLKAVVNKGLNLYLEQVLNHGFFHGDPHPGNLLVLDNNQIVFIDFGNMGKLLPSDRDDFEEFMLASVEQDAVYLSEVIEKIAIYAHIGNRKQFERTLNELFEIMGNVSIGTVDLQAVFSKLWSIIGNNQIHFPEYIYQLIRGISLIEGIGKKLDPELNILDAIRPFSTKIALERLSPAYIAKKNFKKLKTASRQFEEFPSDLREIIKQIKKGDLSINHEVNGLKNLNRQFNRSSNKIALAVVIFALLVLSGFVILAKLEPIKFGIPLLAFLLLILASILAILLLSIILKRYKD